MSITPDMRSFPQTLRRASFSDKLAVVKELVKRAINEEVLCKVRAQ